MYAVRLVVGNRTLFHGDSLTMAGPLTIIVLSAEESRANALREAFAKKGFTAELGYRLAGLTDGEGHFAIAERTKGNWCCSFILKLRLDDLPLLELFAKSTGLGTVRVERRGSGNAHPCARWEVIRKNDCACLVDLFRAFPLWSKKAKDFAIWADAVEEWLCIQRTEAADWSRIIAAASAIREARAYVAPEQVDAA